MADPKDTASGISQERQGFQHQPVMIREVLDLLQIGPDKTFVDGTLGLGGHASAILEHSSPSGRLWGIDRDPEALALARQRLSKFGDRFHGVHDTFDHVHEILRSDGLQEVDGVLLDLGVSSLQLDKAERGFSFLKSSALDMRMDLEEEVTARELLDDLPEKDLEAIFREYGEERFSKRIAYKIVCSRQEAPIRTTDELRNLVSRAVPFFKKSRTHPATRVFQALRIAVNRELDLLKEFLKEPPSFIRTGGTLVILSYHSLEDRIVKEAFRSFEGFQILTKKPLRPQFNEVKENPRARSAKLRAIRRTA
jgi:16S rRNA (cytosine1402-N4)-methyltransferase